MLFLRNTHSLKDAERKEPINLVGIKEKESQKGVSLELAPETLGALNRLKWKKDLLGRGKSFKKKNKQNANHTEHLGRLNKIIYMEIPKTMYWNFLMVFRPLSPAHSTDSIICVHLILYQQKGY